MPKISELGDQLIGQQPTSAEIVYSIDYAGIDPTLPTGGAKFNFGLATFAGVNSPASSRNDTVLSFGYNVDANGARENTNEPSLRIAFENYYRQGGTATTAVQEFHIEATDTGGTPHRFLTFQLPNGGVSGDTPAGGGINVDLLLLGKYDGTTVMQWNMLIPNEIRIGHSLSAVYQFEVNNTPVARQKNAAGTDYVYGWYIDNHNRLLSEAAPLRITAAPDGEFHSLISGTAGSAAAPNDLLLQLYFANVVTGDVTADYYYGQATGSLKSEIANYGSGHAVNILHAWTADPYTQYYCHGGLLWSVGADNSDADKFKISKSAGLGTNDALTIDTNLLSTFGGPVKVASYTVSALPAAATVGAGTRAFVTDALTPTFMATVTGGGAVFTPVYSDGTTWRVG